MTIQHSDITEAELHENKGVSTASSGEIATADGAGNTVWQDVAPTSLEGLSGNGTSGQSLSSDGVGGFAWKTDTIYGEMGWDSNYTTFVLTAAADSTLDNHADYVLLTGTGAPWVQKYMEGTTFNTDRIAVSVTGDYLLNMWISVRSFPAINSKISLRVRVNGTDVSEWHPILRGASTTDWDIVGISKIISLTANDYIQILIASTDSGNIVLHDCTIALNLLKAT